MKRHAVSSERSPAGVGPALAMWEEALKHLYRDRKALGEWLCSCDRCAAVREALHRGKAEQVGKAGAR